MMTGKPSREERSISEYDVSHRFLDLIEEFESLRLAVYTPSPVTLPERKVIADRLFTLFTKKEKLPIPNNFKSLFTHLEKDKRFKKLQSIVDGNEVLGAILASVATRMLLESIDSIIQAMENALLEEEDDLEDESTTPSSSQSVGGSSSVVGKESTISEGTVDGLDENTSDASSAISQAQIESMKLSQNDMKNLLKVFIELAELRGKFITSTKNNNVTDKMKDELSIEMDKLFQILLKWAREWKELLELVGIILPGIGWGHGLGDLKHEILDAYSELSKILKDIPELKELVDRLGRYEAALVERVWSPDALGKSETFSVTRGHDINRLLPSELVKIGHPVAKYLFYAGLVDGSLLNYQLRGAGWSDVQEEERGPVVICVDTSGSMTGLPEIVAKSVSLAVTKEANKNNRAVHIILFGSRGEIRELTFQKSESALSNLVELLGYSFGGGTNFDSALNTAMDTLDNNQFRLADILFVTDGYAEAGYYTIEKLNSLKENQRVKIYSLIVGGVDEGGTESFSDEVWILEGADGPDPNLATLRRIIKQSKSSDAN